MIAGLFLRHYKIYKGATFIPFGIKQIENLNLFIGQNGAGKSSILEALDTFFNGRQFIVHNTEKRTEAFSAPFFMISEKEFKNYSIKSRIIIQTVSDFLISTQESQSTNYKPYKNFFEQKEKLIQEYPTYFFFLFATWAEQERNQEVFITFDDKIKKKILESDEITNDNELQKALNTLKTEILNFYSYQYIPVETSIEDFLRLESKGMQELMSENVKKRIEKTLNEKLPTRGERKKQLSILDIVNEDLDIFVDEVEKIIQEIDKEYDFEKDYKTKTRLTANHLTDVVIDAFFSKRTLKKSKKPIKNLSAGERKKALVDIAYAFLTQDTKRDTKVILAIDEPESSLHISMCYEQFERLETLANQFNIQLFITTHWYGALPIVEKGNLYHIDSVNFDTPQISEFSFRNYFEERGSHPNDIQFKSFFDLASAIISSLRIKENNWLIVESEEDKKYIEKHLISKDNLKILPVGGCTIVKLLYDYLYTPISQKSDAKDLKGKIFCLIDTDIQGINIRNLPEDLKTKLLILRRLQVNNNNEIELIRIDNNISYPTEIEESLNPLAFYNALKTTIENSTDEKVKEAFYKFKFDENIINSYIKGDNSIIYPVINDGSNPRIEKEIISNFVDKNKLEICNNYCAQDIAETPKWINEIEKYFS
jgi:ABC-type cobalamin/Fe3+-siderophores transport system ATPase subunit